MKELVQERIRLSIQQRLENEKSQIERNKLGQFATPTSLAREILLYSLIILGEERPIRFLDPGLGTGSFFSALAHSIPLSKIAVARGYEIDSSYVESAQEIWQDTPLEIVLDDFTQVTPPVNEIDRFNLVICNPPYVRHHHIVNGEKSRLQNAVKSRCGISLSGLAGLYCYFLLLSHVWMQQDGIAAWLVPSEFMDVNYGKEIKQYLLRNVTLLKIHRFDPNEVQFKDALVSSAVVLFRNSLPPPDHHVEFTYGGSLLAPKVSRLVSIKALEQEKKWTRFPTLDIRQNQPITRLSDIFTIKRGIATGCNSFFILNKEQLESYDLPQEVFRPILPSPRYLPSNEVASDEKGYPIVDRPLFLLDCHASEDEIREKYPSLWKYLETGKPDISKRYLCKTRKKWYWQEKRLPAPILCTYLGRGDAKNGRTFRFILNNSQAVAANVYLLLYPKPAIDRLISEKPMILRGIWESLNTIRMSLMLEEGRVYGGGLHKLEPKELGNIDITEMIDRIPELRTYNVNSFQLDLDL